MLPRDFHPVVHQWWFQHFASAPPTEAQLEGWSHIRGGEHTLIAAPTGSGKTLAAFLTSIDELLREGIEEGGLPDEVRVIYVSPLKALSADIHKNLAEPRRGIRQLAEELGHPDVRITAAVRTGDTTQADRAKMLRRPPHILVTTPESLYLLLTAERTRDMLKTARTVIVDEIHSVIESRRGSHLALTLERLDHAAGRKLQRIGLSATQRPIETVAQFLVGTNGGACSIVDRGHRRAMDLELVLPDSPLEAVMATEVWGELYEKLVALIREHRTTLIFVNTRRLAERLAHNLSERLGRDAVMAHHGSLAKEVRLDAETKLKEGRLQALVATASLELGIDIGHVDLVCQIASPRRIATLLQRVGRSGHNVGGLPKGRVFPLTRDDLVECTALLQAIRDGELDHIIMPERPLDVLAQQIVAEVAAEEWHVDALYDWARGAYPYRELTRVEFDDIVQMVSRGFSTQRGRRGALLHYDTTTQQLRGRRGARWSAITSGGAIPDVSDYRVILEPEGVFIGTVNEDFAVESMAGDVFQLGNTSWRILRIQSGIVRVADAQGEPPGIPFWFGEAPARSDEVSAAVARLRLGVDAVAESFGGDGVVALEDTLGADVGAGAAGDITHAASAPDLPGSETMPVDVHDNIGSSFTAPAPASAPLRVGAIEPVITWLMAGYQIDRRAAEQLATYLLESRRLLGVVPSQEALVLERFFDEAGGMQLVLHAPFGARVNRAWGLSLRKKFCQSFNFELQAAATDEGLLLSLGPSHSFPLEDVFRYLNPTTVRDTLVQALLDAPMFQTRWRWNATISLAVPRSRGSGKVPPQLQRMIAEDLLAAVFPDAAACFENIQGERQVPEHPLVNQVLRDCLEEAMDLPQLIAELQTIMRNGVRTVARDTPEPSPLCHEILNARPYAFLDDAPLEERRTQAVITRRATQPMTANDLGALDVAAIERVRLEAWPDVRDPDELLDALLVAGVLRLVEVEDVRWHGWMNDLVHAGRAARVGVPEGAARDALGNASAPTEFWVAAERLPELLAVHPDAKVQGANASQSGWTRDNAIRELVRSRTDVTVPVTTAQIARTLCIAESDADAAMVALEGEGKVLRGYFTPLPSSGVNGATANGAIGNGATANRAAPVIEWADRRLLARIHRYTLNRLRAEIEPVSPADFLRFLFRWQRVASNSNMEGPEGLAAVIEQLDGFEAAASAWESDILPARVARYEPMLLDQLCLSGRVAWGRNNPGASAPLKSSPIALMTRRNLNVWRVRPEQDPAGALLGVAREVYNALQRRGASFFHELVSEVRQLPTQVEQALGELVGAGLITADSFTGMRALLIPQDKRASFSGRNTRVAAYSVETAGRWSLLPWTPSPSPDSQSPSALPQMSSPSPAPSPGTWSPSPSPSPDAWSPSPSPSPTEEVARALLKRYGVVFRALLARESRLPPWRELALVYRRMEARGEIRGGRFLAGFSGEQFALPEAVSSLRAVRREEPTGEIIAVGGADPLNLVGIITPDARVAAVARNRVLFRDGLPLAALENGELRVFPAGRDLDENELRSFVMRRVPLPELRAYLRTDRAKERFLARNRKAARLAEELSTSAD